MARICIIANPTSGRGKAAAAIPRLEQFCQQAGLDYTLTRTEYPGHAVELARAAAQAGCEIVVAAGGDGTINEVINGLMEAAPSREQRPALGVLCIGRGNDFAFGMGIPQDLEEGILTLAQGHRITIDIGRVYGGLYPQGRYFGNCVGIGFDAIGTIQAARLPRFLGGFLSYLVAVLLTIFLYHKGPTARIQFGETTLTQGTLLVSIMNGRRIGGGFLMAPTGQPNDGLLDLCIAGQVSRLRIFGLVPHFTRGTQVSQPEIRTGQAQSVVVEAVQGGLPAQTDGEILCVDGSRLEVELLPKQLDIITRPEAA